ANSEGDARGRKEILGRTGPCHIATRGGAIVRYMGDTEHGGQAAWMDVRQGLERDSDGAQAIWRGYKPPRSCATLHQRVRADRWWIRSAARGAAQDLKLNSFCGRRAWLGVSPTFCLPWGRRVCRAL